MTDAEREAMQICEHCGGEEPCWKCDKTRWQAAYNAAAEREGRSADAYFATERRLVSELFGDPLDPNAWADTDPLWNGDER